MNRLGSLSILVPVYNWDVRELVSTLNEQLINSDCTSEIIVLDDCSQSKYQELNQEIAQLKRVKYKELTINIPRAHIRNQLAEAAQYEWLLFLDCDVKAPNDFINNYLSLKNVNQAIVGGRPYEDKEPDREYKLHWKYGSIVEFQPAKWRKENPYSSFLISNLLIKRALYLSIKLDERITKYGHEDTLFGFELENKNIEVLHIHNPVYHIGLNTTKEFLFKTKTSVETLKELVKIQPRLKETRLVKTAETIQSIGLGFVIVVLTRLFLPFIEENLTSQNPKLSFFNWWKLYWYLRK